LSVGESVSEVDLEPSEGAGPVVRFLPRSFGSEDGQVARRPRGTRRSMARSWRLPSVTGLSTQAGASRLSAIGSAMTWPRSMPPQAMLGRGTRAPMTRSMHWRSRGGPSTPAACSPQSANSPAHVYTMCRWPRTSHACVSEIRVTPPTLTRDERHSRSSDRQAAARRHLTPEARAGILERLDRELLDGPRPWPCACALSLSARGSGTGCCPQPCSPPTTLVEDRP
jgi:hypothetical protein